MIREKNRLFDIENAQIFIIILLFIYMYPTNSIKNVCNRKNDKVYGFFGKCISFFSQKGGPFLLMRTGLM